MSKAEDAWMSKASEFCIVCYLHHSAMTPAAIHHLLTKGGRRRGHLETIGLCPMHHQHGGNGEISRHPNKRAFEVRYGDEDFLLAEQRRIIAGGVT